MASDPSGTQHISTGRIVADWYRPPDPTAYEQTERQRQQGQFARGVLEQGRGYDLGTGGVDPRTMPSVQARTIGQAPTAPQLAQLSPIQARSVQAPTQGAQAYGGVMSGIEDALAARGAQVDAYGMQRQQALGQGPSAAYDALRQRQSEAAQAQDAAARQAALQFGLAGNDANLAMQMAGLQQTQGGAMAGDQLARQQAIAAQQGTAGMGAAFAGGQQAMGGLTRGAGADILQAAQQQAAANQQAGLQQFTGMQGAAQGLQQGTLAAAQMRAGEQLAGLQGAVGAAQSLRQSDLAQVGLAEEAARLGLSIDDLANDASLTNALLANQAGRFNLGLQQGQNQLTAQMQQGYGDLALDVARANVGAQQTAQELNLGNTLDIARANAQNQLANQQLAQALEQYGLGGMMTAANQAQSNQIALSDAQRAELENAISRQYNLDMGLQTAADIQEAADAQARQQTTSAGISAAGAIIAAAISDEATKTNIRRKASPDFSRARHARYEYLPEVKGLPGATEGEREGPMAQELPEGAVFRGEDGILRVHPVDLSLHLASAMGDVQRRLKRIERRKDR